MKNLIITLVCFSILLLIGCSPSSKSPDQNDIPINNQELMDAGIEENDEQEDAQEASIQTRDMSTLASSNSLDLYLDSPLRQETQYTTTNSSFIKAINGKRSTGGMMDTETGVIQNTFTVTQPIQDIEVDSSLFPDDVTDIEICTPDGCTSVSGGEVAQQLQRYFTGELGPQVFYLGTNYYLIRVFTSDTMIHQLITVEFLDIDGIIPQDNGAQWHEQKRDAYIQAMESCYSVEDEEKRAACQQDAKLANTISLERACKSTDGIYDNFLTIESNIATYSETMSWMKQGNTLYYAAQHTNNEDQYISCENMDHAISFHRFDCEAMTSTELHRMTNMGSMRLSYFDIELAGLLEGEQIVYASFAYEGPYCATAENYKVFDPQTKGIHLHK